MDLPSVGVTGGVGAVTGGGGSAALISAAAFSSMSWTNASHVEAGILAQYPTRYSVDCEKKIFPLPGHLTSIAADVL